MNQSSQDTLFVPRIAFIQARWHAEIVDQCRIAFVGIGHPMLQSSTAYEKVRRFASIREMEERNIKASILFHLIDADGKEVPELNKHIPSVPLEQLQKMARNDYVVGVATGDKAEALHAILIGGYVSAIVIDNALANAVLG